MVIPKELDNETLLLKKSMYIDKNTSPSSSSSEHSSKSFYYNNSKGIKPLTQDELRNLRPFTNSESTEVESVVNNNSNNNFPWHYDNHSNTLDNTSSNSNNKLFTYVYEDKSSTTDTESDSDFNQQNTSRNYTSYQKNNYDNRSSKTTGFIKPKRLLDRKDRFDINLDTTKGFSNKTLLYNKNYSNRKDYLSKNSKSQRNAYKNNRVQRKTFSLVIRNKYGITHDRIIENIKKHFEEYKVLYIIVSFEGREAILDKNKTDSGNKKINDVNHRDVGDNNTSKVTNQGEPDDDINNNFDTPTNTTTTTPTSKSNLLTNEIINITTTTSSTTSSNLTIDNTPSISSDNNINNTSDTTATTTTTTTTTLNPIYSQATPYDTSPHFHVLFKTKRTVDVTNRIIFDKLSINDKQLEGSTFIIRSQTKDKLNEISYIVKDGNVKTWGEIPKVKPPKVRTGDDVAKKIMNNCDLMDIIKERPGFALINFKKIKEFREEFNLLNNMKNLKPWNMLLINIENFNEKELEIFDWMIKKLPIIMLNNERAIVPLSDPQIYIYGGINAGKTFLASALRKRLPTYDFNENDHHNLYSDDLTFLVIKDEFKGGPINISKINQFLDGQEFTLNTKGGVTIKKRNQPCMFFSNFELLHIYVNAINTASIVKKQLLKRFKFVNLGEYKYLDNTDNEELSGNAIYTLFNLTNSIENQDKESYDKCEKSFKNVYGKSMLKYIYESKRVSDFTISKILRYKHESFINGNKESKLSIDDIELLNELSEESPYCKELLNDIQKKIKDNDDMEIEEDISNSEENLTTFYDKNESTMKSNDSNNIINIDCDDENNESNFNECIPNHPSPPSPPLTIGKSNSTTTNTISKHTMSDPVNNSTSITSKNNPTTTTNTIDKYSFIPGISNTKNRLSYNIVNKKPTSNPTTTTTNSNTTTIIDNMDTDDNNNNYQNKNNNLSKRKFSFEDISLDDTLC